jgi:hypothetical protein
MTRSVDQVQDVFLPVFCLVRLTERLAFNGDAPLPFNIHIIKDLILELTVTHHVAYLDESVSQGGFAMVDMGDNAEITDIFHFF